MTSSSRTPRIRVLLWTRRTRDMIEDALALLVPENEELGRGLIVVLDELAKNAIKANHKHLIIRRRLSRLLGADPGDPELEEICSNTEKYNEFLGRHPDVHAGLTKELSAILREESVWLDVRNRKHSGEEVRPQDLERLKKTDTFKELFWEVKRHKVYVEFRASRNGDQLWVELINTAPIIQGDLDRIESKRAQFRTHREAGTEYEFFLTAMDGSDGGAGLGYATIDSHLASLGVEPMDALRIISLHSTNAMLNLDLTTALGAAEN